ncbi:MAG TPA: SLC13 family permease [Caulobacteraceae bacterium]|nr:SLC13 family permease [Caulobacteraceae bacterium]
MTTQQALTFAILAGAVACFAWGRFRYDVVSLVALLVSVLTGVVSVKAAFSGFTSDVVVIIASALVISAAVARSGVIEQLLRPVIGRLKSERTQVPALAAATAALSMLTKNVGALAILMPVATRLSRGTRTSRSALLMPMSFMALLGGLVTLVGTSTNIIVSQIRQTTLGKPFQLFDFAPVGLGLTALGLVWVSVGWRLLPRDRQAKEDIAEALSTAYAAEASVPDAWPDALKSLRDLDLGRDQVKATALIHAGKRTAAPRASLKLHSGDTLVLEGDQEALTAVFTRTPLVHAPVGAPEPNADVGHERAIEAVIQPNSILIGRPAGRAQLLEQFGVKLSALSRSGERIASRLGAVTLRAGDVLILEAGEEDLPGALRALGLLPLIEREVQVRPAPRRFVPITILVVAMLMVAFRILPVQIAFFAAAVAVVASGALSVREAYGSLDAQVLILIGALTPISEAVRASGGDRLVADALAGVMQGLPALLVVAALMATAMACSPFLHNAPTVLILGPIGVALATRLSIRPDAFLMAVATGAGCDFLSPVGHQCNTLVMGPGGYRFGDYARLGAPLSVLVLLVGAPLIAAVWPLR